MSQKVTLDELIGPLEGSHFEYVADNTHKKLTKSLRPEELRELKRKAARSVLKDDISRWNDVIKENKEKINVVVGGEAKSNESINDMTSNYIPQTDLEVMTANLLKECGNKIKVGTLPEDMYSHKVSREELQKQLIDKKKLRAYLSFKEAKSRKTNKIKSKKYRQLKRKERSCAEEVDHDDDYNEKYKMEFDRALSRLTLKKQASQKKYANAVDIETSGRALIIEDLHREEALMKGIGIDNEDGMDEDEVESIIKTDPMLKKKEALFSMPFMQNAMELSKEEENDESEVILTLRKPSQADIAVDINKSKKKFFSFSHDDHNSDNDKSNSSEDALLVGDYTDDLVGGNNDLYFKRDLIASVFEADNVVQSFAEEKEKIVEIDAPKVVDETVPGWGHWAGAGVDTSRIKKKLVYKNGIKPEKRKDAKLKHVIINEHSNANLKKYTLSNVPFPFVSSEQYEETLKPTIGRQWSATTGHLETIKPNIQTVAGKILQPVLPEDKYNI